MLSRAGTSGYHPTFTSFTASQYQEPTVECSGYTEPDLTTTEHAYVIAAVSLFTAVAQRPIMKLERFYFLSDVPGESNRIMASDKRAQVFRTLLGTRWLSGRSLLWGSLEYSSTIAAFLVLRAQLPFGNATNGFVAGGVTGLGYTLARHPYDVLRATAEAPLGPRHFTGVGDVLRTAVSEKPQILLGLYKGFAPVALGRMLQLSAQFGVYNATRYDAAYRGNMMLFLYCHAGAIIGAVLQYPFFALRQQLRLVNAQTRLQRVTTRSLLMDLRRKHGLSKVFDGFFSSKPLLNAVPPALAMTLYDIMSRRYTEYLHPEQKRVHASPDQSLVRMRLPKQADLGRHYEFGAAVPGTSA